MSISRKHFIKAMAAIAAMGIFRPKKAIASESDDLVVFSPEIALDYAEQFVKNSYRSSAGVDNPIPIVDIYGQPSGYAIDIIEGGGNSGYVLLDTNCPELITTFCFNSGALGPYQKQMSMLKKTLNSSSLGAPCLLQLSPLDLFPYDEAVGIAINTDGVPFKPLRRNASTPKTEWNDLLIPTDQVYGSAYTITSEGYIGDYWFATEGQIEENTGKYACAVTALYTIAGLTWTGSGFLIDPFSDWSCYDQLWKYTGTTGTGEYSSAGAMLGTTEMDKIGPGFVEFCRARGFPQNQSNTFSPAFSSFQNQVSNTKHSVFSASITRLDGSISGHSMSVNGWACLKRAGLTMNTLSVFDGWYNMKYLNVSYSGYRTTHGTYF